MEPDASFAVDPILLATGEKSYFSSLPVTLNQSNNFSLTSYINMKFPCTELLFTGCFFCYSHHSVQALWTVLCENPRLAVWVIG